MNRISPKQAQTIAIKQYGIDCEAQALPGDEDENFRLQATDGTAYLLKISQPNTSQHAIAFENAILDHLQSKKLPIQIAQIVPTLKGTKVGVFSSEEGDRTLKLLTWVPGRLWASINPKTATLRTDLGNKAGALNKSLGDFIHPKDERSFHWNLANAAWTNEYIELFEGDKKEQVDYFQKVYAKQTDDYKTLPKSVIHNDLNDYNILVSEDVSNPVVQGIIDFGDAVFTQTVNDVAILIAYGIMELPDPLDGALDILRGYAAHYAFTEKELHCLYALIGMRLVTTVTKAALRRKEESQNEYHAISEAPAWALISKWRALSQELVYFAFRDACDLDPHPQAQKFEEWAEKQQIRFGDLFPSEEKEDIYLLDLKVSSTWIGSQYNFNNLDWFEFKINELQKHHPKKLIADGYIEPRPVYTSSAYDKEGNNGPESRSVHLGIDFWLPAGTPVQALFDGEVITAINDAGYKEYGGLIILKHSEAGISFFTLHGHLSAASTKKFKLGDRVRKGECIGHLGNASENGEWSPHLHFQIMLSMLDYTIDFPGVTYPKEIPLWKSICPDPNLLFKNKNLATQYNASHADILDFRRNHLGKGLSISYVEPLHIVRAEGVYMIDSFGRKYLDTVNNVNHVGHQHPKVVAAGQKQMALLNTNTRYLHEAIIEYAEALLKKLPEELCVLHFVNSGSEANELAIRMAKTATGREDMMAIEVGYHGNTNVVMEVSSYKFDGEGGQGKPAHTHILPLPDPFRGIHPGEDSGERYAAYVKELFEEAEAHGRQIAGFIGEPIISCGGQIMPPKGYFKKVYEQVREGGGYCIADEVQTGFGRVGSHFWAFQLHDVLPDIVTMGKPVGNGHPLAVVACTREIAEKFDTGMEFFNTFGGNPVSCAIGKAVLDVVEDENLQQNAWEVGTFLKEELIALQQDFSIIGDVRGIGLFIGFELVDGSMKPLKTHTSYLANRMKDFKILMSIDGPDHNVIKIKPPMVFSIENAKEVIFRLKQVFSEDYMLRY